MAYDKKTKLTHLKPVKEYKEIHFDFWVWQTIDELIERFKDFEGELKKFKEVGWEGVELGYDHSRGTVKNLYRTHFVEDQEYNDRVSAALQNKPNWEDAPQGAKSLGIAIWDCDYKYEWVWFYHEEPHDAIFVEHRPQPST